jgi:phosphatidylinositol alpha-mannosyltransferase
LRVLFNGTWMWSKGIADLAVVVPDVLRRVPGSTFTLLTTANCDLQRALPEDLRSRVAVVHRLTEVELLGLYQDHDVFVHPTVNDAPLPLVVLEAMAAGLAVVTSRLPHFDRTIRSGENGILVTPRRSQEFADAVVTLLHDPALRERLGAEAQRTALQYPWDRVVEDLLAAYDRLVPARTPGGRTTEASAGQAGGGP